MKQQKNLLLIVPFILLIVIVLSACNSEQTKGQEKMIENEEIQQKEQKSNKGMGWTHDNPMTPTAGEWGALEFKEGKTYKVDAPPADDSETTKKEIEELVKITNERTDEEVELVKHWAITPSPNTHWFAITEELIQKYKLSIPEAARVHAIVSGGIYTTTTAAWGQKYEYLRKRPTDLETSITLVDGVQVPPHPAYPNSHASTAWTAATILSYIFPNEKGMLEQTAEDATYSRMLAGVHFRGDHEASIQLAKDITADIIDSLKDDHAPLQYEEIQ
ncbi:hypothetical protein DZB84_16840 [Bacillus sp. HNG]|uniref:phosphatase PAP2 family protein n=1 Tax=Bacillus sp. HNG TaxID=2293325 RepID=UPI000E2F4AF7|nr:hypothetical protein [Bacillus sp. HNG]RFB13628.1 hypothetical protein DZB84_16840 [Bacillus sp. HNG]